jgi:hypothetical protein
MWVALRRSGLKLEWPHEAQHDALRESMWHLGSQPQKPPPTDWRAEQARGCLLIHVAHHAARFSWGSAGLAAPAPHDAPRDIMRQSRFDWERKLPGQDRSILGRSLWAYRIPAGYTPGGVPWQCLRQISAEWALRTDEGPAATLSLCLWPSLQEFTSATSLTGESPADGVFARTQCMDVRCVRTSFVVRRVCPEVVTDPEPIEADGPTLRCRVFAVQVRQGVETVGAL